MGHFRISSSRSSIGIGSRLSKNAWRGGNVFKSGYGGRFRLGWTETGVGAVMPANVGTEWALFVKTRSP
jgi:hypothetical protein